MINSNSSKRILLSVIGIFILVIAVVGVTFAFFNYIRTGSSNTIKVGRISFVSRNEETISLNNLFPIDPTVQGIMDDDEKVGTYEIEIQGDTDYSGGIEYLLSASDANIYTNQGQILPISLDMTVTNLGTENNNYFTARDNTNVSIYKRLVGETLVGDEMLLVGYIKPNTTLGTSSGVNGKITIKAYLDKNKILISDTYDGTESDAMGTPNSMAQGKTVFTTNEWNSLQTNGVSFKIKVEANEGIWVIGSLNDIMRKSAVMDNINSTFVNNSTPGIDFVMPSSDTNGKGVYTIASTANDDYPIMYYRGDVDNNNVLFANKCWKTVRTTDTGGVKLIYNGEYGDIYERIPLEENEYTIVKNSSNVFSYDSNNKFFTSHTTSGNYEFQFKIPSGNYLFEITGTFSQDDLDRNTAYAYAEVNDYMIYNSFSSGGNVDGIHSIINIQNSDVVEVYVERYESNTANEASEINVRIYKIGDIIGVGCDGNNISPGISVNNNSSFPYSDNNLGDSVAYVGYMYGTVYVNGEANPASGAYFGSGFEYVNGEYRLVNPKVGLDSTHHYTCNLTTPDGTCSNIRFYYYSKYYTTLTDGVSIETALSNMKKNITNSTAKTTVDEWYQSNMLSYNNKIEDTIYCNDRSIVTPTSFSPTGELDRFLLYNGYNRTLYGEPTLTCRDRNDAFTVSNGLGNGMLTYPVALITSDELVYAGLHYDYDSRSYIRGINEYFTMTPFYTSYYDGVLVGVALYGKSAEDFVDNTEKLRPVISLKPNIRVVEGDGTELNPYVIE